MDETEKLDAYFQTFNPLVRKNVTYVQPTPLYHMSINGKIAKFVPTLSRRTLQKEDRSVPRVSVAPTVHGCLLGYQADYGDFEHGVDKEYQGGWYIYGFNDQVSVRPSKPLLHDVDATDEHWLVPYTSAHWQYPAELMGKFFFCKAEQSWNRKLWVVKATCALEVFAGQTVQLVQGEKLTEGYYSFVFYRGQGGSIEQVSKISAGAYQTLKGLHADLLSYQEPPSAQW